MKWSERFYMLAFFLLLAITVGFIFPAGAADLRVRPFVKAAPLVSSPVCRWCGIYFGVNAGYGGADFESNFSGQDFQSLSAKHSANSILGGAHIGYNYQFGSFVLGAETDIMATGIKSNINGTESTLPWLGTTRLRGGFLVTPDFLIYGTGGAAYGHVKVSDVASGSGFVFTTPTVGWTLGGGVEYALSEYLKVGAEYLHVDLDGPGVTNGFQTIETRVPVDIVRGRLSVNF